MASNEFFSFFYLLHNSTPLIIVNVYPLPWTLPEKKVGMPNSCGRPCPHVFSSLDVFLLFVRALFFRFCRCVFCVGSLSGFALCSLLAGWRGGRKNFLRMSTGGGGMPPYSIVCWRKCRSSQKWIVVHTRDKIWVNHTPVNSRLSCVIDSKLNQ